MCNLFNGVSTGCHKQEFDKSGDCAMRSFLILNSTKCCGDQTKENNVVGRYSMHRGNQKCI